MQIDFLQFCKDYNIDYQIIADGWVNVECPICRHHGDRGYKGGFNIYGGYFNCWACGGHNLNTVIMELLGIQYHEVENVLAPYLNQLSVRKQLNKKTSTVNKIELPIDTLDDHCKRYLIKRNYDPELIEEKYKVTGTPLIGPWAGRLIIPIYYNKKLVSFQGRSLYSKAKCKELNILRYKTLEPEASVVNPKTVLYNLDNCTKDYGALFEGAFDVWRFGNNCMATLGTSTTPEQHILLAERFKKLFIIFDPEKEAQERAEKLARQVSALGGINVEVINTELKHDPGDMSNKEVNYIKKELGL